MDDEQQIIDSKPPLTITLVVAVFLTCFGSSLLYGYNMAVLNLPADNVKCFLNLTILRLQCKSYYDNTNQSLPKNDTANIPVIPVNLSDPNQGPGINLKPVTTPPITSTSQSIPVPSSNIDANFLYAQTSTIFVIGGFLGAFTSGMIADALGRRNGLLLNHAFAIIGAIVNGVTVLANNPWLLYIGRCLIGINSGVTIGIASMFLMEIAPRHLRGAIGACHQLAVTIGIVVGYILTMTHTLNSYNLWPYACGAALIPAAVSLFILPVCPESPRFLYIKRHNLKSAKKSCEKYFGHCAEMILNELASEEEAALKDKKFKISQLFTEKEFKMPLLIACLLQVIQQLSGINAVISYSSSMLTTAGIPESYGQYCVIGIGVLNVVCTIISLFLIDKFGRRTLILWPTTILAASLICLTVTVNLVISGVQPKVSGGFSVFFIMTYIVGFAFGLGPVPALFVAEIFRQECRASAYSISQAVQWISNLIVLFIYPNMNKSIGGYSFLPFLVIVIGCWVFFYLFMPETQNRTFDDIASDMAFGMVVTGGKKTQRLTPAINYAKPNSDDHANELRRDGSNVGEATTSGYHTVATSDSMADDDSMKKGNERVEMELIPIDHSKSNEKAIFGLPENDDNMKRGSVAEDIELLPIDHAKSREKEISGLNDN